MLEPRRQNGFARTWMVVGCMLSINPDAHSIPELDHMHWGVEMARLTYPSRSPRMILLFLPSRFAPTICCS
ncbi:hypothetical protein BSZ22_01095 [Bradyrhizobium canariense]|uniref:Uncharacterized protein n=1 Tax=Bradyrhizobium canariense TaxID=255045 RepID=A0A1X3G7E1_9BRAD|nr:hypothetical protein BSZ20_18625 [Bradyrhizobium canariense]OSI80175.1 hypothetical protein BSZ22_01095 [Bradyrhizobium canariense]OSI82457.1 hypothetical protein BSZ23_01355 [Bradyrhizobium canariense]OSI89969.1 hypothetical protein BSZ25_19540 [Bradyrhizobium canariense]OSI99240.1 hypothetical protein BSZ24_00820 [Bradyrhizobium canariense]